MIIGAAIRQLIKKWAFGVLLEKQRPEQLSAADHCSRVSAGTVRGVCPCAIHTLLPRTLTGTQNPRNKTILRKGETLLYQEGS